MHAVCLPVSQGRRDKLASESKLQGKTRVLQRQAGLGEIGSSSEEDVSKECLAKVSCLQKPKQSESLAIL